MTIKRKNSLGRRLLRASLAVVALAVVIAGAWCVIYWARYPKVPDVSKAPLDDLRHFAATDDFNRMAEWHRRRYLLGLVSRMHEKTFPDLVALTTTNDPDRPKEIANLNRMTQADRKEIGGAWMRLFLDKFFELSKSERDTYLTLLALGEKAGGSRRSGDHPTGLPTPEQINKGMTDFLSEQSPHTAAQMDELMNELNKKRQMLGLKGPWG